MTDPGKADGFHELLRDIAAYLEKKNSIYLCVKESSVIQNTYFKTFYFILIYLWKGVYVHMWECCWGQKRVSKPLELELQAVTNQLIWVTAAELRSSQEQQVLFLTDHIFSL